MGRAIGLNEEDLPLADGGESSQQMKQEQEGGNRAFHRDRRMDRAAFQT